MDAFPTFANVEQLAPASIARGLEYVGCLLCGGTQHAPVLRGRDSLGSRTEFQIVRCENCSLHFTNPRPTVDSIGRFYGPEYRPHNSGSRGDRPLRGWFPQDWLQLPTSLIRQPRLLDFGCGAGQFLAAMHQRGWAVTGLDASEEVVESIRENRKLDAILGTLPNEALDPGSFQLITMWHSLEHVHDPVHVLREARRLLSPRGRLVLAVPNFMGWASRWFGEDWFGLELPRHITHFSAATLTKVLQAAGFRVKGLRFSHHADWVRASAVRAREAGGWGLLTSLLRAKKMASLAAWLGNFGTRGDCILVHAEEA